MALGSGVVIQTNFVATNCHVLEGAATIYVRAGAKVEREPMRSSSSSSRSLRSAGHRGAGVAYGAGRATGAVATPMTPVTSAGSVPAVRNAGVGDPG